jgi:hypothetical protein
MSAASRLAAAFALGGVGAGLGSGFGFYFFDRLRWLNRALAVLARVHWRQVLLQQARPTKVLLKQIRVLGSVFQWMPQVSAANNSKCMRTKQTTKSARIHLSVVVQTRCEQWRSCVEFETQRNNASKA